MLTPIIVAHRGLWAGRFVENSHEAFAAAAAAGFGAECDVQAAADGEPVVIHDETLERTTTGRGAAASFTSQQLRSLRLRDAERPAELGGPVPLLADVAHLVALVEVKPRDCPDLVWRVIRVMSGRQWLLQSFDERNLVHARQVDPSVAAALLVEDADGVEAAIDGGWTIHLDHQLLDQPTMHRLRDRGLRVGVWTVNTEEEIRRILPLRPDVIISDQPQLVRRMASLM